MTEMRSSTLTSLERGLVTLEFLADCGQARLAEVATHLGTSRSTAFRLLATLQRHSLVEHLHDTHTYRLGSAMALLAARAGDPRVIQAASGPMAELRGLTGETINLVALRGVHLVYEAVLEGRYTLRTLPRIGQRVDPHSSALGKAVLSRCSGAQRSQILGDEPYPRYTTHTITDRRELDKELAETIRRGYALDYEESELGLFCVGAPITGIHGRLWGALSISGLASRMNQWDSAELGTRLTRLCADIASTAAETNRG